MPVSITLERADVKDPQGYEFMLAVSFSEEPCSPSRPRTLSMVEVATADDKQLYSCMTGAVLSVLKIADWEASPRVKKYKQCIRIALLECDVRAVFADCSRALSREVARARAKPESSSAKLKLKDDATGTVDYTRSDESHSERTRCDDQRLLTLANELSLAKRKRYLSLFFPDRSCFT